MKDLFDDNNKYYRQSQDCPLKICQPLGLSFLQENKRKGEDIVELDKRKFQRKRNSKPISAILKEKDNLLEQLTYNKVSNRQVDDKLIEKLCQEIPKQQKQQQFSDTEYKNSYENLRRDEFREARAEIYDKIELEQYQDLKALKCQNLLNLSKGFIKKENQLSQYYHVFGTFEHISYLEYLKRICEEQLSTSILKVWLPESEKLRGWEYNQKFKKDLEVFVEKLEEIKSEELKEFIQKSEDKIKETDSNYEGIELYLGLRSVSGKNGYFEQEKQCQKKLLIDLCLICQLVDEGGNCVLKFYNSFQNKSLVLLFIFYKIFKTTVMCKPRTSSLLSNERFLVCQGLKKDFARQIGKILVDKFDILQKEDFLCCELKHMTQDQKFCDSFIEKFMKNMVKVQTEFFDCLEVLSGNYTEVIKQELKNVFSQIYYKDIVQSMNVSDKTLKKELGIKKQELDEVIKEFVEENQNEERVTKQEDENQEDHDQIYFSEGKNSLLEGLQKVRDENDEIEKVELERRKKEGEKKNEVVINQIIKRDLNQVQEDLSNIQIIRYQTIKKRK
ncbi:hypothetical protein IMG5_168690 [Ichthyophthirius multifiliis]|uniref:Cap-specific mRNA (nucleoside-2'-O-)-methyltransferase 1 n=1 Tax=Ichthyophthirius multifiliis TaxID=5932 RepID=G0R166_ICHMU|nr:hypothetical protein IMG5_168690 [Ichthyophthirius multifiliis]EGR28833.1 hypothetical protein IMG5_168690 [Ichthyophthirius multifiliis]|eukprot:XP_004030069.1 hypothetical protein IMG5_168690 [Ichthyophthirius multifiliis]